MANFTFRCSECGSTYAEDEVRYVCPACSGKQRPGGEVRGVLEVVLDELPSTWPVVTPSSWEFLEAFLPLAPGPRPTAHGSPSSAPGPRPPAPVVGDTPLFEAPRLREELKTPQLWLKDDTRNPSGSTKDRASLLVVAKALEYGFDTVATASTGNAATALASMAAAAGLRAVVFVSAAAPRAKLVQMAVYGARVVRIDGTYDQAFELCREACGRFSWYNRNTALNPFTVEGKKTAALEIAHQLGGEAPNVVVVPTGDGVIVSGVAKGFDDLVSTGLLNARPRLIAVQPTGSPAIIRALGSGDETVKPVRGAASVADSLTVEVPRNARLAVRRIRESGGGGVEVEDEAILRAIRRLAQTTGIFAEPAAAAALAGLEAAIDKGLVNRDERIVLLITGTGLKDVPAAESAVTLPPPIAPDLAAIARVIDTQ